MNKLTDLQSWYAEPGTDDFRFQKTMQNMRFNMLYYRLKWKPASINCRQTHKKATLARLESYQ